MTTFLLNRPLNFSRGFLFYPFLERVLYSAIQIPFGLYELSSSARRPHATGGLQERGGREIWWGYGEKRGVLEKVGGDMEKRWRLEILCTRPPTHIRILKPARRSTREDRGCASLYA